MSQTLLLLPPEGDPSALLAPGSLNLRPITAEGCTGGARLYGLVVYLSEPVPVGSRLLVLRWKGITTTENLDRVIRTLNRRHREMFGRPLLEYQDTYIEDDIERVATFAGSVLGCRVVRA